MGPSTLTIRRGNLDALPLAARRAVESEDADVLVQTDSTGMQMSASVRTPDGRLVRFHSGRDPIAEADRYLDHACPGTLPPVAIVIGPGLGYILETIERRAAGTKVIAIEPFAGMARAMLERRDWREWIHSGRLTLVVGPDYVGASDAGRLLDDQSIPAPAIEHPVLGGAFPAQIARAREVAQHIVRGAQSNAEARRRFAGRYLLNTIENLPALIAEGDVSSLRDLFHGVPALVVAAGPSLDRNIAQVRAAADRALIIAVDTTLRPLRAAGIRPHLVAAVDPSELNAKHLIGATDTDGSWLVSEGSVDPRVFSAFAGRVFGFRVGNHHPWPWLGSCGFDRGVLRAWGSVLTTAFDLACHAGCDPIVFAGVDLAYTDGVHYCRGTIHEDAANHSAPVEARADAFAAWQRDHQRPTCRETDIRGASIMSTPDFVQFRDWLVSRSVSVQPRRVLNATGAGILHGGAITQIDLAELSLPPLPSGADQIQTRLEAAWGQSIEGRCRVATAIDTSARQDGGGVPLGPWLAFAGDTASPEQIAGSVEAARHTIALAWNSPPAITAHPTSQFWIPGLTASFTAAATGAPAPTVQWQTSSDHGASWSNIADATDTTYECTMTSAEIGKQFRAVFTNPHASVATTAASIRSAATGVVHDFTGNGKPDILWRSVDAGENVIWYMDGLTRTSVGLLDTEPDLAWAIVGVGDFSGSGKPDILWHQPMTGESIVWCIDGVTRSEYHMLETETDVTWTAVGVGDFNGDGQSDILWRNRVTGALRVWYMNGMTRAGLGEIDAETDLEWTVVGAGDFNGDGRPDILWRNAVTGANRIWYMNGVSRMGTGILDSEADLAWTIIGTGDFDGDGRPDILWRNQATGATRVWCMDGVTRLGQRQLDTAAAPTCQISRGCVPTLVAKGRWRNRLAQTTSKLV
jgi:hypothetical protein